MLDPFKRTENGLRPEIMDLSNGTSAPTAYEELRRHDENQLQQSIPTKNLRRTLLYTMNQLSRY